MDTYKRTLVALLVTLLSACATARAEEISNDACLACHGSEGFASPTGRPLVVDPAAFAASVHGPLPCTACHTDATVVPHAEHLKHVGIEACATCHSDIVATYRSSIHGRARANGAADAATCTSCHGSPHAIKKASDPGAPVYPLNLPRTCGACHGNAALAKRHGIPVANAYQLYMDSIHGRALTRDGLLVAANCSSCHGTHDIEPKNDPRSKVFRTNIPSTCGRCHAGIEQAYFAGSHGRALKRGDVKAPVCINCHTAHQIARVDTTAWRLYVVAECGTCHVESLRTYRDTFHGQVTTLGFTPVARCADCHGAHHVLPASDPASSIAPAHLVATCQKCHPRANANFVRYAPHADFRDGQRNPGLFWVARFMTLLIVGVFVFFGVHTILWLVRGLAERHAARREHRRGRRTDEE